MKEKIRFLAEKFFPEVKEIYHHLHKYPELSGHEKNTSAFICEVLDKLSIPYEKNVAGYGVVAILEAENPVGKVVALRADMDALPIQENSGVVFSSVNQGVMHACGHDIHTACLLGTLMILQQLRSEFCGKVKAIFQPSEEEYDGGAKFMIDAEVLKNPDVDVIIGQHVTPGMEVGTVGFRAGAFMASTDEIHVKITGKGGHAARPSETLNPIYAATDLVNNLMRFFDTEKPVNSPSVLSFGKFVADGSTNVVPETAILAGTFRTFDELWRKKFHHLAENIASKVAADSGCAVDFQIVEGYPVLVNDPEVTDRIKRAAEEFLGSENVEELPTRLTAEDFAYYLQVCKGVFYRLGVSNSRAGIVQTTHSPYFRIDENALLSGIGLMSFIALKEF